MSNSRHYARNFERWRATKHELPRFTSSSTLINPELLRSRYTPQDCRPSLTPMRTYFAFGARNGTGRPLTILPSSRNNSTVRCDYGRKPELTTSHIIIDELHNRTSMHLVPHNSRFHQYQNMPQRAAYRPIVYPRDSVKERNEIETAMQDSARKLELHQLSDRISCLEDEKRSLKTKVAAFEDDQRKNKARLPLPSITVTHTETVAPTVTAPSNNNRVKELEQEILALQEKLVSSSKETLSWQQKAQKAEAEARKWRAHYESSIKLMDSQIHSSAANLKTVDTDLVDMNRIRETMTKDMQMLQKQMEDALQELKD